MCIHSDIEMEQIGAPKIVIEQVVTTEKSPKNEKVKLPLAILQ